jgi:hypothetical protein
VLLFLSWQNEEKIVKHPEKPEIFELDYLQKGKKIKAQPSTVLVSGLANNM